jgi:hypothetical protein
MHALTGVNALLKMFYTTKEIIGNCPKMNRLKMFLLGAMLPFVIILFSFSLFEKIEIDFERYRTYLALVAIISIYHTISKIIKGIKQY